MLGYRREAVACFFHKGYSYDLFSKNKFSAPRFLCIHTFPIEVRIVSIFMNTKELMGYIPPEIEMYEVMVEQGFATSGNLENPEYDEDI